MAKGKSAKPARRKVGRKANARRKVEAVPSAYGSVTPGLSIRGCAAAIEFYKKAFGARELSRMPGPGGSVMHAELKIGDSIVMMGDASPEMGAPSPQELGGSPVALMLYVKDCDAVFQRAVEAGATVTMPLGDMFWGDRYGQLKDPFGHRWSIGTHKVDLTPKQMAAAHEAFMAEMAKRKGGPPPGQA
jgi:PhnB protein